MKYIKGTTSGYIVKKDNDTADVLVKSGAYIYSTKEDYDVQVLKEGVKEIAKILKTMRYSK